MTFAKKQPYTWEENGYKVVRSIARSGPGCHEGCGVLLFVKDGRLVKVEGDPGNPFNKGRLCPRCLALPQVVYHPDRLRHPLRRTGKRGQGKWERISWKDAFAHITKRFGEIKNTSGPEAVIFCSGTGRDISPYITKLAYSFGSPNRVSFGPLQGHACFAPKVATMNTTIGDPVIADFAQSFPERYDNPNWKRPEVIVIWGNNPVFSNSDGLLGHWLIDCMRKGSEVIVIDPRKIWLATRAKLWLQIRPGTDAALALGLLYVIITEKLYDEDFIRNWTYGFDELKARVQDYDPETVSQITWIPAEKIIEAARIYAAAKPAALQWGVALDQSKECLPTIHAIIALWSITGNLDVPGGNIIKGRNFGIGPEVNEHFMTIDAQIMQKKIGWGRYPFLDRVYRPAVGASLLEQMSTGVPYLIRAAWIQTTNTFVCGAADSKRVYENFKKLDFVVVVDLFMTPTVMAFADIVLPAATYAERDGIALTGGHQLWVGAVNKAIEPVGECKSDMEINLSLGKQWNPGAWPWPSVQDMFSAMIKPMGVSFEELREIGYAYDTFTYQKYAKGLLRPDKKPGFKTPTGKVELYATVFEECGLDPLPYFEEPPESPLREPWETRTEYPLILTTGAKTPGFFHSEHRQIPLLRQLNPDPLVEIHPQTAETYGIKEGDWVCIENRHGKCRQRAKLTYDIHPQVIHAQHGWWFPEKPGPKPSLFGAWESNINVLLPSGHRGKSYIGKAGFGFPFKSLMCRVYKEKES